MSAISITERGAPPKVRQVQVPLEYTAACLLQGPGVLGDWYGKGAEGRAEQGLPALGVPLPGAPALFADALACLKYCVSFTLGPVRPSEEQFHKYLPWFLNDPPNTNCPKG